MIGTSNLRRKIGICPSAAGQRGPTSACIHHLHFGTNLHWKIGQARARANVRWLWTWKVRVGTYIQEKLYSAVDLHSALATGLIGFEKPRLDPSGLTNRAWEVPRSPASPTWSSARQVCTRHPGNAFGCWSRRASVACVKAAAALLLLSTVGWRSDRPICIDP